MHIPITYAWIGLWRDLHFHLCTYAYDHDEEKYVFRFRNANEREQTADHRPLHSSAFHGCLHVNSNLALR